MLHACFVYDPTCFMCIFIQYLAFSGTNVLRRCRSASSCFLLYLYFRKVKYEIFSESDQTKAKVPNIPEDSGSQKGSCWRARSGPDMAQARAQVWSRLGVVWPTQAPPRVASSPISRLFT